jgi:hypothetical protein
VWGDLRPWRWDKQVIQKRWSYIKKWRRVRTQNMLSNITTTAEAFNYTSWYYLGINSRNTVSSPFRMPYHKTKHVIVTIRTAPWCQNVPNHNVFMFWKERLQLASPLPSQLVLDSLSRAQTMLPYFVTVSWRKAIFAIAFHICFMSFMK